MPNPTASSSSSQSPTPSSGILTTPAGDRRIPQSMRPDGSVRKEIRVRPGYRPPEDVEVYKNRTAEAWKTRGTGGVPGALGLKDNEGNDEVKGSAGKNAKRREARKRAKATEAATDVEEKKQPHAQLSANGSETLTAPSKQNAQYQEPPKQSALEDQNDPEPEQEKQARNLRKKLRQARELKEKKESGENLLPEQFGKVIKIQELIRQLDALGFDSDGARKPKDVR